MKKRTSLRTPLRVGKNAPFYALYNKESDYSLSLKEFLILDWLIEKEFGFPSSLSRLSNIPRSEIYTLCNTLQEKGWLNQKEIHNKQCYHLTHYKKKTQTLIELLKNQIEHLEKNLEHYETNTKSQIKFSNLSSPYVMPQIKSLVHNVLDHHIPSAVSGVFRERDGRIYVESISDNKVGQWIHARFKEKLYTLSTSSIKPENKIGFAIKRNTIQYDTKLSAFTCPTISTFIADKIQELAKAKHIYFIPFCLQHGTARGGVLFLFEEKKTKKELLKFQSILNHLESLNLLESPL